MEGVSPRGIEARDQASHVDYTDNEFITDTNAGTLRADQLLVATGRTPEYRGPEPASLGVEPPGDSGRSAHHGAGVMPPCAPIGRVRLCRRCRGQPGAVNMTGGEATWT